jgi:small nuclear ribonucleoprotein (snRNP)-like protein
MSQGVFQVLFRALLANPVIVELKNGVVMKGILQSTDDFLNLRLTAIEVLNASSFPPLPPISQAFVRGSAVACVHIPPDAVDLEAVRAMSQKQGNVADKK